MARFDWIPLGDDFYAHGRKMVKINQDSAEDYNTGEIMGFDPMEDVDYKDDFEEMVDFIFLDEMEF